MELVERAHEIRDAAYGLVYRGDRYDCPVCGAHSRSLLSHGGSGRPNAACPRCRAAERHRFLFAVLERQFGLSPNATTALTILHIAPERSIRKRLIARVGEENYTSLDLDSPLADVHADLTQRTPLDDGAFDLVLCSHVLEHIPDDAAAMRELRRVTAPTGTTLVMVPHPRVGPTEEAPDAPPAERARRFGQADHVRWYGDDLVARLTSAGFEVDEITPEWFCPDLVGPANLTQPETGHVYACRPTGLG